MTRQVVNGALLRCSAAMPPGVAGLSVQPVNRLLSSNQPVANILDHVPLLNIPSFGMCASPSSPMVIAATSAAMGVFTPVPCLPATPAPWVTGTPTVLLANIPMLNNCSTCQCLNGGQISISFAGQATVEIPP
ncbi:DUF4280 domain-containing protein [Azotobacter chroococcum]|uniref:DUF4280 domain-containing protein n=1 Tax=Azotobacter chroococcum TaxID=353 RepID=UPI0010AE7568|nr:DUF4280 domain-containing protein [Azotobacter chroococcum]TKD47274.1 DUF4280 domain-containing protein [Azotobacter chroococcum]